YHRISNGNEQPLYCSTFHIAFINTKELEKKFSQTAAYTNMKKMLCTKNDQIKELRTALATFQTGEA
ncbi:hypothetical protein MRX96_046441, partial [Rhipicephalus microplus]